MIEHRPSDSPAAGPLDRMHRLDLGMIVIDLLEGSDGKYFVVGMSREKHDRGVEQFVDLKGVGVLRRTRGTSELQVDADQAAHVSV